MKNLIGSIITYTLLAVAATGSQGCGSSAPTVVDPSSGKAISSLDIGGDITLDKGSTQQMTATVKYADGSSDTVTNSDNLVWNIGNTDVATISKTGVVTGNSIGATKVRATYQGKESSSRALVVK